ncbi:MAG: hypothetical protein DCC59_09700 [Chloroflexi bacterium]|nr:hypothetical protein [Chloroflexi bacterium CFX1]MCK6566453.1 hypothetical protein [Anaerolineales bacterium]MCQ3953554.1 hypothetical protein [Chloroflexota bacterium]MDL1920849.1 hypothetical protein [Chloroflexi bacterium CFX5]NUQ59770.1 hypothetical protein [Anaerolineales bacterium]
MTNQPPAIRIKPLRVLFLLLGLIALLVSLSIWGQRIKYFGVADIRGYWHEFFLDLLMSAFYLDAESNIPSFVNALLLFIPALLFSLIGAWKNSIKDKFRFHWIGLGALFLLLSFDEAAALHERLIKPMRNFVDAGGVFHFAWVVPGLIAVALFAFAYLFFFLNFDKKFKTFFILSFSVYIAGATGGEMVSGYVAANLGLKNFTYAVVASLEESVEMIGCSLIIYALLEYIKQSLPEGLLFKPS